MMADAQIHYLLEDNGSAATLCFYWLANPSYLTSIFPQATDHQSREDTMRKASENCPNLCSEMRVRNGALDK